MSQILLLLCVQANRSLPDGSYGRKRRRNPGIRRIHLNHRGSVSMSSRWWRIFLAGAAVIIVVCLAMLEIAADRASLSRTMEPVTRTDVPEHPWESR